MSVEVDGLIAKLKELKVEIFGKLKLYLGTIDQKKVVIVKCGVGKVYAAAAAAILLSRYKNISLVINLGVAGGVCRDLRQGDFALGANTIQHDCDLTAGGLKIGQVADRDKREFVCCESLVKKMSVVLGDLGFKYKLGTIVSGDQFINCKEKVEWLRSEFNAIACDMETASIAQVCEGFSVPFLVLRSISDNADESAITDFDQFCREAAARSISAVEKFLKHNF